MGRTWREWLGICDVLKYFKRSENRNGGDPYYRGQNGPLEITSIGQTNAACDAFIEAVSSLGVPKGFDYNAGIQKGAGYNQRFIDKRARRVTASSAYLKNAIKRAQLKIITDAQVTRVKCENKRAKGVEYVHKNASTPLALRARREVILCAGTVNSTKLLQLSGQLASIFDEELVPGPDVQSDDELLSFAKETGNTGYHLVGTNKMGQANDPMAVVSPELKVHGMDGLRVIDASVMPRVTSANTCAATYMIAEKGADLVLFDRTK